MNRFSPKSGSSYKFPKIEKVLYKDTLMKKLKHVNISLKGSTIQQEKFVKNKHVFRSNT